MNQATPNKESLDRIGVTALHGVGPRLAEKLAALDIHTVQDLLFHLPLRYQDRTRITPIGALQPGRDAVILTNWFPGTSDCLLRYGHTRYATGFSGTADTLLPYSSGTATKLRWA